MNQFLQSLQQGASTYLIPLAIVLGSVLVGLILEKIVLKNMKRLALKTKWKADEIIIESLKGMAFIWCITAGTYAAILRLPLTAELLVLLKQILIVIVITTATIVTSRIALGFIHLSSTKIRNIFASTSIFANITKILIFMIGILISLQTIGISITPILTALGVGGFAVALALQDSLSNLFSGLHIIASRQVKPGDFVKMDSGEHGYVHDITWRNTTIKALSNNMIIVPNAKMASTVITNYSQPQDELLVKVPVVISYDNDLALVEKVTEEIAGKIMKDTPGSVAEFKPFIRFEALGDTHVALTVIMRGKEYRDQFLLRHEFIKKLHDRYKQEGIHFTSPGKPIVIQAQSSGQI